MKTELERKAEEVERAARRLAATEGMGPRARKNARSALAAALRRVRNEADVAYPAPARKQGKRRSAALRVRDMQRDGWDELNPTSSRDAMRVADLAHRGIRVVKVVVRATTFSPTGAVINSERTYVFAPPWTKDVPVEKLGAARESHQKAQAFKAVTKMQREEAQS